VAAAAVTQAAQPATLPAAESKTCGRSGAVVKSQHALVVLFTSNRATMNHAHTTLQPHCRPVHSWQWACRVLTCGNAWVPTVAQNAKVAADSAMTPYANLPATVSASRWIGAVRACKEKEQVSGGTHNLNRAG
jgi:hypothetical protein